MKRLFCLFLLFICSSAHGAISVKSFGGAEEVSGSMHILTAGKTSVIIDAGISYDEENLPVPPEATGATAMALTHAHADHSAKIPLLIASGFKGNIYCTEPTKTITLAMFEQGYAFENVKLNFYCSAAAKERAELRQFALTVHFNNCKIEKPYYFKSTTLAELKKSYAFRAVPCKKCLKIEIAKLEPFFKTLPFGKTVNVGDISFYFFEAGHIPGAASVYFTAGGKNIIFSGDLGNNNSAMLAQPETPKPADYIFMESTYSGDTGTTSTLEDFNHCLKNNSLVWVSAFALDRTQKVLYQIRQAQDLGFLSKNIKVYAPSPSANKFTKLYLDNPAWFKQALVLPYNYSTKMPKSFDERVIIISSSASMDKGTSAALLPLIENPRTAIAFVGYVAPETPAGLINAGSKTITAGGKTFNVKAKFKKFDIFSAHITPRGSVQWLSRQNKNVKIYLTHGENQTIQENIAMLKSLGFKVFAAKKAVPVIIEN